jgi:hypothetical protein
MNPEDGRSALPRAIVAPGDYVAVFRARSSARFLQDEGLAFTVRYSVAPSINCRVFTRYVDAPSEELIYPIPRELVIEASGTAESTDDLLARAGPLATAIGTWLAFVANAAVDDMQPHLAFDNTAGRADRSFIQVHVPDEAGIPRQGRKIPVEAALDVVRCLVGSGAALGDPIRRAIGHYALALQRWYLGGELLALASLYIAAENLDKAVVVFRAQHAGQTPEAFARAEGLSLRKLQARVRREIVFDNDRVTYDTARAAVDGLEHGSMGVDELHATAQEVCPKAFRCVRRALAELLELPPEVTDELLSERYGSPVDSQSMRFLVRGVFQGVRDELAAAGELYPLLRWRRSLARLELDDDRQIQASFKEHMTVSCSEGVAFRATSWEVHGRPRPGQAPIRLSDSSLKVEPSTPPLPGGEGPGS